MAVVKVSKEGVRIKKNRNLDLTKEARKRITKSLQPYQMKKRWINHEV